MAMCIKDPQGLLFAYNHVGINWLTSDTQVNVGKMAGTLVFDGDGNPFANFDKAAVQDLINRCWAGRGTAFPPGYTRPA